MHRQLDKLMKKNLLVAAAAVALGAFAAQAQAVESPAFFDNVYIGVQGGVTAPMHGTAFFKGMRGMVGLEAGKQITPTFGVGVEGLFGINTSSWPRRTHSTTVFDNGYLGAYGTVDLVNLFGGYPCRVRPFTVAAQLGIGWGHYFQNHQDGDLNFVATKFGLNFNYNVTDHLTLALKPSLIYNLSGHQDGRTNFDINYASFQLLAGVSYRFGDGFRCVRPYDQAEVDALNAQINDLRAQDRTDAAAAARWQARADSLATALNECNNRAPEVVRQTTNQYNSVRFVFFRIGSHAITADQMPNVTMIADYMNSHPDSKVVIKGYASRDGNYDFNIRLAQERAEAVKRALMQRYRIPESRIIAEGEGIGNMFEEESWNRVSICTLETGNNTTTSSSTTR